MDQLNFSSINTNVLAQKLSFFKLEINKKKSNFFGPFFFIFQYLLIEMHEITHFENAVCYFDKVSLIRSKLLIVGKSYLQKSNFFQIIKIVFFFMHSRNKLNGSVWSLINRLQSVYSD